MRVLMVCLGNICRSPIAEAVLRELLRRRGTQDLWEIDSAGIAAWNAGDRADPRAVRCGAQRGYDLAKHRARILCRDDFFRFDWILAMDTNNLAAIEAAKPVDSSARIARLLDFGRGLEVYDVPDPYFGGERDFYLTLTLIEHGCDGFLDTVLASPSWSADGDASEGPSSKGRDERWT